MEILLISAWFHDTGFMKSYENHEAESINYAKAFFREVGYPEENQEKIIACINSTRMDVAPETLIERVLHDADFIHLTKKSYFDRLVLLKAEKEKSSGKIIPDHRWYDQNQKFLSAHKYHTGIRENRSWPKGGKEPAQAAKIINKLGKNSG
jgi:HD superfamily phosphodiesterase